MSRKARRVPVSLDAQGIQALPPEEIALILRGADELIMRGGRTLLAKVLKGSREKRVRELALDGSPAHGALREHSLDAIQARIDWLILNDYLALEYDYRLPLLVYTQRGWEIERDTYASEMLEHLDAMLAAGDIAPAMEWLNEKNREVQFLVLDRIETRADPRYVAALESWAGLAPKKLRRRIRQVIDVLRGGEGKDG